MSKSVLFYDGVTPKQYTLDSLTNDVLGGTEATVLRVAQGLADGIYRGENLIYIEQRHRTALEEDISLIYLPLESTYEQEPKVVITLRDAGHYIANKKRFPNSIHYLWLHDLVSGEYQSHLQHHLNNQKATIIAVSDFHKANITDRLYNECLKGNIRIKRVYNPLAEYCIKTEQPYTNKKLVYFSSPHKGLDSVVKLFSYIRNIDPEFKLFIANPGYLVDSEHDDEGIVNLGSLTHAEVVDQVRTSLCVFYPNTSFAETFGLVYAEANAVGTPVIAHPIGAAKEILSHPHETFDCRDYKEVVDRVIRWSKGERPIVSVRREFRLETVISEWKKLIG